MGETMNVRVVDRGIRPGYEYPVIQTIAISAFCPKDGQRRGEPYDYRFPEDGDWLTCDKWDNPCGHVDTYGALLAERRSIVDANGTQVALPPDVAASDELRTFMAGRVPAAGCPHYMAKSEADAGLTKCERCSGVPVADLAS